MGPAEVDSHGTVHHRRSSSPRRNSATSYQPGSRGNVIDMKVVAGPPLLYQAALDALKKWKYEPTYLNDQPIAVEMIVTITFQLGQ